MKGKLKRKLIASFCFDIGTSPTTFECPVVSVFWEIEAKKKPFQMTIRSGFVLQTINFPYKNVMDYLKKYSWIDLAKDEIRNRLPTYTGKLQITDNEYYVSEAGKRIATSNTQEQVEKWILS